MRTLFAAQPGYRATVRIARGAITLRPVSLREINALIEAEPGAKAVLGLGGDLPADAGRIALKFMRMAIERPRWRSVWWFFRSSDDDRRKVFEETLAITFASKEITRFFRPSGSSGPREEGPLMIGYGGDLREDPLVQLNAIAVDLSSAVADPFALSPLALVFRSLRARDRASDALLSDATAARVAQADEKGWKRFVQDLTV